MKRTRAWATGVSLLLGAVAGVVVGANERGASPPRPAPLAPSSSPRIAAESALAETPATPPPASSPEPSPARQPAAAAVPAATSSATEAPVPAPAFDLTPPASKDELFAVETRCTRNVPEDCERAARAIAAGELLARDTARAKMLNRIALTVYVKQCESDRALACARLAEMHEHGEIVQKNPGTAKALRARYHELCGKKPDQMGCATSSG